MSVDLLRGLRNDREITQQQYVKAMGCTNPRVTFDGDLWVTTPDGRRILLNRKGLIAFNGKNLTGQ